MKLIIVNDGNISINADTITKIEMTPEGEGERSVFAYVKNSDEIYLVGRYKTRCVQAFACLNAFLTGEKDGTFACQNDNLLIASYPEIFRLESRIKEMQKKSC